MVDSLVHHAEVIVLKGETYLNTAESRKTSGPRSPDCSAGLPPPTLGESRNRSVPHETSSSPALRDSFGGSCGTNEHGAGEIVARECTAGKQRSPSRRRFARCVTLGGACMVVATYVPWVIARRGTT